MDKAEYENIYRNEESHFYYVSLHKLIISLLTRYKKGKTLSILDAGCGTGRLAQLMKQYGTLKAVDFSNEAIKYAKMRGISPMKASVTKLPFENNSFDVVTSIDVIYHKGVPSDTEALREMLRVLKKGGILIIRVQANPWLSLSHDRHVHGARRYTKTMLCNKLKEAGFSVQKISYVHMALIFPAMMQHVLQKIKKDDTNQSSVKTTGRLVNYIGSLTLLWEIPLLRFIDLPFGLGVIAVATKD